MANNEKFDEIGRRCINISEPRTIIEFVQLLNLCLSAAETAYSLDITSAGACTVYGYGMNVASASASGSAALIPGLNLNQMTRLQKVQAISDRCTILSQGVPEMLETIIEFVNFSLETLSIHCYVTGDMDGNFNIVGLPEEDHMNAQANEQANLEALEADLDHLEVEGDNWENLEEYVAVLQSMQDLLGDNDAYIEFLNDLLVDRRGQRALERGAKKNEEAEMLTDSTDLIAVISFLTYLCTEIPPEQEIVPFNDLKSLLKKKCSTMLPRLKVLFITPERINTIIPQLGGLFVLFGGEITSNAAGDLTIRGALAWRQARNRLEHVNTAIKRLREIIRDAQQDNDQNVD